MGCLSVLQSLCYKVRTPRPRRQNMQQNILFLNKSREFFRIQENFISSLAVAHESLSLVCIKKKKIKRKDTLSAYSRAIHPKLSGNRAFPQNFHPRILDETKVFYAVNTVTITIIIFIIIVFAHSYPYHITKKNGLP